MKRVHRCGLPVYLVALEASRQSGRTVPSISQYFALGFGYRYRAVYLPNPLVIVHKLKKKKRQTPPTTYQVTTTRLSSFYPCRDDARAVSHASISHAGKNQCLHVFAEVAHSVNPRAIILHLCKPLPPCPSSRKPPAGPTKRERLLCHAWLPYFLGSTQTIDRPSSYSSTLDISRQALKDQNAAICNTATNGSATESCWFERKEQPLRHRYAVNLTPLLPHIRRYEEQNHGSRTKRQIQKAWPALIPPDSKKTYIRHDTKTFGFSLRCQNTAAAAAAARISIAQKQTTTQKHLELLGGKY